MVNRKRGIGVIGCGARGKLVVGNFLKAAGDRVEVKAVYDPDPEAVRQARAAWQTPDMRSASSMPELVNAPDVEWVAIFTPNAFHCAAILAALAAGKQVFSEKPLATTLEDCQKIMDAEAASGISIATGFVLRYAPIYREVKKLLSTGTFGRIINIAASENRESYGGGNSMSADYGWRRFRAQGGPYLLEKCSHDLDLLNWFAESRPSRVASFCGLNYFIPEHANLWDKYDHDVFARMVPLEHRINPFLSEKDIFDNHAVVMEYPEGIMMSFQLTLANAIPERRMYISCTEGNIIVECFTGTLRYRRYGDACETMLTFVGGGHGGGDEIMASEVMESWLSGQKTTASGSINGMNCARVAIAADLAARTGRVVEL